MTREELQPLVECLPIQASGPTQSVQTSENARGKQLTRHLRLSPGQIPTDRLFNLSINCQRLD